MYAIIELGGRQWKVEPGTRVDVNRVATAVGAQHQVERVLFAKDGERTHVGRPYIEGARVVCEVVEHRLGPKEISYHFRRRENWRKTVGHRQPLTRLVVTDIHMPAAGPSEGAAKATTGAKAAKTASPKAAAPRSAKTKSSGSPPSSRVANP